jgi:tellurite methyltransferase
MCNTDVTTLLGATDIYLIDQILKGRYKEGDLVLDAGCGTGRNLHWFLRNNFTVFGTDSNPLVFQELRKAYPAFPADRFRVEEVEKMSFPDGFFDHLISSAVLHFAQEKSQFFTMLQEMLRVLKPGGSLFIRMASDIGIEDRVQALGNGVFLLPDGSTRFLLTRELLQQLSKRFPLLFLEEFKTTNVNDIRCMSTLMLQKRGL